VLLGSDPQLYRDTPRLSLEGAFASLEAELRASYAKAKADAKANANANAKDGGEASPSKEADRSGTCALAVLQHGQSGRLSEGIPGHHGLLRLRSKAWGCPPHSCGECGTSDPTERPWPLSQRPPKLTFSLRLTIQVLLRGHRLFVASVGDCRAVLLRDASHAEPFVQLTTDMRANTPSEEQRIKRAGGQVSDGRVWGALIPSRTIGDISMVKVAVLVRPKLATTGSSDGL